MRHLVLRNFPSNRLWNKEYHKWNERDKEEFEFLRTGIIKEKPQKQINAPKIGNQKKCKKVMRIADEIEYESISDAARRNGMHHTTLRFQLKNNKSYCKFKLV